MSEPREELATAIGRIAARVLSDPDVIGALNALGKLLNQAQGTQAATGTVDPSTTSPEPSDVRTPEPVSHAPAPEPAVPARREPLRPLTLGQSRPSTVRPVYSSDYVEEGGSIDLETIVDRCRIKAEATRWAVERKRRLDAGEDFQGRVAPGDRDLLDRARALPTCYLWMNTSQPAATHVAANPQLAETLAQAFEVVALAAELLQVLRDEAAPASPLTEALHLAAEAQSGLRVLVEQVGSSKDADQFDLYLYLREVGAEHQIYIRRYMKLEDPADPTRLTELRVRLGDFAQRIDHERGVSRERRKLLSKLRYHSKVLREGNGSDADRRKVIEAAGQLVATGLPPSSPQIRDHVAPILDDLPEIEDAPAEFSLVRREAEHHRLLVSRLPEATTEQEAPSPEVAEVANLLRGRSVVMICNVVNPDARDALLRGFELTDVDWIVAREHQSIERFKPNVARADVALVLLTIRWSSHSFGDLKEYCEELGKPFIQLPGGYNVNQVAAQILAQASKKLRAGSEPSLAL